MFQQVKPQSNFQSAISIVEVIYHATVRRLRSGHGNAVIALVLNMLQAFIMLAAFYFFFTVLGLRGAKVRGDFVLFIMSGIFVYMGHIKAVAAVTGAANSTSSLMQHAPMNTAVTIISAALSSLYTQILSLSIILFIYYAAFTKFVIHMPLAALGMVILGWATGCAVGLVFFSLKPWFPTFTNLARNVYIRANMIASGKLFVANTLPPFMLTMFDWNPLFHIIDQNRGFIFENYFPRNTSIEYPILVGAGLIVIGLMGEFYTRQHASSSWSARR